MVGEVDNFKNQMYYFFYPFFRSSVMRASSALSLNTWNCKTKTAWTGCVLIYKTPQTQQSNKLIKRNVVLEVLRKILQIYIKKSYSTAYYFEITKLLY